MNLVRNGSFSEYTFKQGQDWGTGNRGIQAAGSRYGGQFLSLGGWTWGKYTGHGKAEYPNEVQGAVGMVNGAADGHFPPDTEHPFAGSENLLDMNGDGTLGFIEQSIPVASGQVYELSFYHGYNVWPTHGRDRPTYLRVEVDSGGHTLLQEDYIQYYSGDAGKASHGNDTIHDPAWRKRRLSFRVPAGEQSITLRFADPGRKGLDPEQDADTDGGSGMQLAHVRLEESGGTGSLVTVDQRKPEQSRVKPGQPWTYPCVLTLTNAGSGRIGTHKVVFTAPEGLYFIEDRLGLTRQDDDPHEIFASAVRSDDNRTLTCPAVPLDLAPGKWAAVYPAMGVLGTATPGTVTVGFELGEPVFATGHATITIEPRPGS